MKKMTIVFMLSLFFTLILCSIAPFGQDVAAEGIVYYGEFDFPVPSIIVQNLSRYDNINNWIFIPDMTRWIDENNDGRYEFIAIALGSDAGYGAQVRYRLVYRPNSSNPELGDWYWFVIQSGGRRLVEEFNEY